MSTDCFAKIYRKSDKKLLGELLANELKIVLDNKDIADCLRCGGAYVSEAKFDALSLQDAGNVAEAKLKLAVDNMLASKMQLPLAASEAAIESIKNDIEGYMEDYANLLGIVYALAHFEGAVECIVENMLTGDGLAYEANGNGTTEFVFMSDVEIQLKIE